MRRLLAQLLLGAIAFAIGLVVLVPAEFALNRAEPLLAAQGVNLTARGIEGTLWQGRAAAVAVAGIRIDDLTWRTSLLPLLSGRLGVDLTARLPGGSASANLTLDRQGGHAEGAEMSFDAALLSYLSPLPMAASGMLSVNLAEIGWEGEQLTAISGRLLWRQAGLTAPQKIDFGDLVVDLTLGPQGGVQGKLSDGGGPLKAEGDITVEASGAWHINALLSAREGAPRELYDALKFIGRPDPQGRYRLRFAGRL